jgi:DNA-directed RNA polymerase specialized sigma54-like protein
MEPQRTLTALLKIALDGRTNRWLSKKTGIQESEISRIVSGRLIPTNKQLEKIRAAFPYQVNF